ncbi:MAG: resolvase [Candidatus Synechococcus spongiarum 142]|uniref:Resolvase n=1 Tax=Candidatus Synechococcus spongiarum 142 TaxID=1608213 RepID=A0A6N3X6W8_9SYNE|nr:MAG: resolvase [Candidatus Synechococcus spongiarum 142]
MVAASPSSDALMSIEDVQDCLNRSRASIYRYANTDPRALNPPFDLRKLNAEFRQDHKDPLLFHPQEVARFARDVLRIRGVNVTVLNGPQNATEELLTAMLAELRQIRLALTREPSVENPSPQE